MKKREISRFLGGAGEADGICARGEGRKAGKSCKTEKNT